MKKIIIALFLLLPVSISAQDYLRCGDYDVYFKGFMYLCINESPNFIKYYGKEYNDVVDIMEIIYKDAKGTEIDKINIQTYPKGVLKGDVNVPKYKSTGSDANGYYKYFFIINFNQDIVELESFTNNPKGYSKTKKSKLEFAVDDAMEIQSIVLFVNGAK